MDKPEKQQAQIENYLFGLLTDEERIAFEKQMEEDPGLKEEVELTRHIFDAFEQEGEEKVFEALKGVSEEELRQLINTPPPATPASKPSRRKFLYIWISAAAAIILLLLYTGIQPYYSTQQLLVVYYQVQAYEPAPTRGSGGLTEEEKTLIKQATNFYQQANFQNALACYNRYLSQKSGWKNEPEDIVFYSAICQLETGEVNTAIEKLDYLAASGSSEFKEEAQWNLAFAYLKNNQRKKAETTFRSIVEKDSEYARKAAEILERLEKRKFF